MELPKIAVRFTPEAVDVNCHLEASMRDIYEIHPNLRVRKGTMLVGTDGDYRCKLEVLEVLPHGQLKLAMHLDTWRQKVTEAA